MERCFCSFLLLFFFFVQISSSNLSLDVKIVILESYFLLW
ncbi:unnamed protein product [Brassica napus]|uniref:(rape) hypothetical protein n=1 Tax=Brassica napus TaxID=3708 RepID=A0A816RSY5_BRANA|nr:unnamed protein product [Brassica napus]